MFTLFLFGCGRNPNLPPIAEVTGTVTLNGQPLEGAQVSFDPQVTPGGMGRSSTGTTDKDGKFFLWYNADIKGASLGKHNVVIRKSDEPAGSETIAEIFNEKTTLEANVTKEGPNDFPFEVKLKK